LPQRILRLAAKAGLQVRHQQCRGDALSGNIRQDKSQAAITDVEKIVIIAADLARGDTLACVVDSGKMPSLARK
jgi:hypothetical protein